MTGDAAAPRAALMGQHVDPAQFAKLLQERFRRHSAYVVPHDESDFSTLDMDWVQGSAGVEGPDAWHADDALLVPLTASDGRPLALLSLDEPARRPPPRRRRARGALRGRRDRRERDRARPAGSRGGPSPHRGRAPAARVLRAAHRDARGRRCWGAVCEGIRDALGFEKAAVFLDEEGDGRLLPAASVGLDDIEQPRRLRRGEPRRDDGAGGPSREGCVLLDSEDRRHDGRGASASPPCTSRTATGAAALAWDHHWLMVLLRDRAGTAARLPVGRRSRSTWLLPGVDDLRALRAFANHAVGRDPGDAASSSACASSPTTTRSPALRNRRGFEQGLERRPRPDRARRSATSTASSASTTRSAIRPATTCSAASPTCCARAPARTTWRSGSAARSSRSC